MNEMLDIKSEHLAIISSILAKNLPKEAKVWAFGSRTTSNARKYSDLDLAIKINNQEIPSNLMAALNFDFEESILPYKVDIVDVNSISGEFYKLIDKNKILLTSFLKKK